MKEKIFTSLVIILSVILVLKTAEAHQPVLNSEKSSSEEKPYIIEEPEVSKAIFAELKGEPHYYSCLLYTSPSPRDGLLSRMPSSA